MNIIVSLLLLLCTCFPLMAEAQVQTLQHKDAKRRYIVYTPPAYHSAPQQAFPVVFNFHGGGMTMAEQMLYTQMNRAADLHGFIVVYPQGIKQDWNVGFGMDYLAGTDDVGFTQAMLDKLKHDYRIDARRVYATGLSRGGFFALRLAAELPQHFAAVASVGAPMPEPVVAHHGQQEKVGMLLIHGTADQVVLYEGKPGGYLSADDTLRYWAKVNGIAAYRPQPQLLSAASGDELKVSLLETRGQQSVALVSIDGGGHTWPGADAFNIGLPIGKTSRSIDANEVMWAFFSRHGR